LGKGSVTTTNTGNFTSSVSSNSSNTTSIYSSTLDSLSDFDAAKDVKRSLVRSKKSIETGRVEKGSHSDQEFNYVNKSFEYIAFHTVEYKLLPVSQKINTVADINVKRYCTNCGSKLGKTDKFCANCGKKS
jgi:hypothetical protein